MEDSSWILELESALVSGADATVISAVTKGKQVPSHLRPEIWKSCLGVKNRQNLSNFDEIYDLPEQAVIREDCNQLVERLGNDEEDKVSILSDVESVVTCYCKREHVPYLAGCAWLDMMAPLLALRISRGELYECFHAIQERYVPQNCGKNAPVFHLFRLLLLYHDPEVCSFLDTKRITADLYITNWFRSLFASTCNLRVILAMWDVYFQRNDPVFVFFLSLVILVNAREQLLVMANDSRQVIVDLLSSAPCGLEADDIEDFCSLAHYYSVRTPRSFRHFCSLVFNGIETKATANVSASVLSQALCLPILPQEILENTTSAAPPAAVRKPRSGWPFLCSSLSVTESIDPGNDWKRESLRFFLVDCRPAEQYNCGHLSTAFHLDAGLMLQEPSSFATAVQALFAAQKQAIAAGSRAGGEHLCFIGSGRDEEDQYLHMVVASFLQRHCIYVSLVSGGFHTLHELLNEDLDTALTDHIPRLCLVCNSLSDLHLPNGNAEIDDFFQKGNSLIGKLSSVVKEKSSVMKDKLVEYITNPSSQPVPTDRHVSSKDRVGRRYRGTQPVFTIDDEHDGDEYEGVLSEEEIPEMVSISTWLKKPDVVASFKCEEVKENGYMYPCYLLVTETHLYVLREIPKRKDFAHIVVRRAVTSIVKITSKKRHPELITFKYGVIGADGEFVISDLDRFYIPNAGDATKAVKQQIMKQLDGPQTPLSVESSVQSSSIDSISHTLSQADKDSPGHS